MIAVIIKIQELKEPGKMSVMEIALGYGENVPVTKDEKDTALFARAAMCHLLEEIQRRTPFAVAANREGAPPGPIPEHIRSAAAEAVRRAILKAEGKQ